MEEDKKRLRTARKICGSDDAVPVCRVAFVEWTKRMAERRRDCVSLCHGDSSRTARPRIAVPSSCPRKSPLHLLLVTMKFVFINKHFVFLSFACFRLTSANQSDLPPHQRLRSPAALLSLIHFAQCPFHAMIAVKAPTKPMTVVRPSNEDEEGSAPDVF